MFTNTTIAAKKETKTTTDHVVISRNESGRIILFVCGGEQSQNTLVNALVERNKAVAFFNVFQENQFQFYSRWFETYVRNGKVFKPETVSFPDYMTSEEVDGFVDKILNSPVDIMLYQMVSWEDMNITSVN